MNLRRSPQILAQVLAQILAKILAKILAVASLSSSPFDANPFSAASDKVPGSSAFSATPAHHSDSVGAAVVGICRRFESKLAPNEMRFDDGHV
jgi:hypothetical protein